MLVQVTDTSSSTVDVTSSILDVSASIVNKYKSEYCAMSQHTYDYRTMNIENSIVLETSCDEDQRQLVDYMPLLSVEHVAQFISLDATFNEHVSISNSIVNNRYSYYGWRNYMYCYMNCVEDGINFILDKIVDLARVKSDVLLYVFKMLYSPVLLLTGTSDKYSWRYFSGRLWMTIDKMQLRGMFSARCDSSNLHTKLGTTRSQLQKDLNTLHIQLTRGDSGFCMFSPNFDIDSNNKDRTFCMSSCTYDITNKVLRKPLPGDLSTLAGDIDPNEQAWSEHRSDMLQVLSTWMSSEDVATSYLDVLASALSEFAPRYAIINSGTGADGKSTFVHIVSRLFGSFCIVMPGSGPSISTKSSNEATPVASAMIGKRVYITTDATDVTKILESSGFKAVSGGDRVYVRKLYQETSIESPRLKGLNIINVNQEDCVATSVNQLTRIRVVKWLTKRVSDEDRDIIPKHQITTSAPVVDRFENIFVQRFGSCMMMELIKRHMHLTSTGMQINLCTQIRQWTKDVVAPKTILKFIQACTQHMNDAPATTLDESTRYALSVQSNQRDASIEELFITYMAWRKTGARFSVSDPRTVDVFKNHIEFYYPISKRVGANGSDELYVRGLSIKPTTEHLGLLYGDMKMGQLSIQQLDSPYSQAVRQMPTITYNTDYISQ